jgi:hypothetical protein
VVNIQVEADLLTDKTFNSSEVKVSAINALADFFDINKWQLNQNIYIDFQLEISP